MAKYQVQVTKEKRWFIRLVSTRNGKTLMTSETYLSPWKARRAGKRLAEINGFDYLEVK